MATVRSIIRDACLEIQAIGVVDAMPAELAALGLRRFQHQIDSWAADRLTLSVQSQTAISWPSSTATRTIGPGGNIDVQRPVWINTLNYVNPGSSPAVEVGLGQMDSDAFAAQSIKGLSSGLPQTFYYQTDLDTVLGTLQLWPVPNQTLTLYLYAPQAVGVPTTLDDILLGPPGYQDAFMYQLALRLCTPLGRPVPALLPGMATRAFSQMKRPNNDPGLVGVDAALVPSTGGAYNILTDSGSAYSGGR